MNLTDAQYNALLKNPIVPETLKKELANNARESSWVFIGT